MNRTGHVDWLAAQRLHTPYFGAHTYVFVYWLADTAPSTAADAGLGILKAAGGHPDWFVHADGADRHLKASIGGRVARVSASYYDVFDNTGRTQPLLASILLGTADFTLDGWACGRDSLTRAGQNLLRKLDSLYLRPGVVVTFQQVPADETSGPRSGRDSATV